MIARDLVASAQLHRGEAETLLATVLDVDRACGTSDPHAERPIFS